MTMGFLSTLSTSTSAATTVDLAPLYIFAATLLFFHGSEFALAYAFQRKTLSRRCESLLSLLLLFLFSRVPSSTFFCISSK